MADPTPSTGKTRRGFRALFGRSVVEEKAASLATPDAFLLELFGVQPSASGVTVTPRSAMRCTAVRCAVQAIAEGIGQLPIEVFTVADDGSKTALVDHPVHALLADQANDWTSAADFKEQLTRDALLHGNGYAFVNRVNGQPFELTRLDPESVQVDIDLATSEPIYRIVQHAKVLRQIDRRDVLHIKAPSLNGVAGESPVMLAQDAIGLALVLERHAAQLFGNGAKPSGILSFPGNLTPEGAAKAKAAWQASQGGTKAGGTAVLDSGASFTPMTLTSTDAQFLELRTFAVQEIARVFRVPPHLLMELGRATWSNSAEMNRAFVDYSLRRWIAAWEGEVRLKLITPDERATLCAEFDLDDLLRADLGQRADAYQKLVAARVLNPNEVRALENRPPYAGGERFENPNTTTTGAPAK